MAVLALQTKKSWAEKHILFGEKILSSTFKKSSLHNRNESMSKQIQNKTVCDELTIVNK